MSRKNPQNMLLLCTERGGKARQLPGNIENLPNVSYDKNAGKNGENK
jgi:hypothetical protein